MNSRQTIIALALAVPVLAIGTYVVTQGDSAPKTRPAAVTPMPLKVAAKAVNTEQNNMTRLAELKARAQQRMLRINTLTAENYAKMRLRNEKLPENLDTYKHAAQEHANKIMAVTQAEFDKHMANKAAATKKPTGRGKGFQKGRAKPRAVSSPAPVVEPDAIAATPAAQ